MNCWWTGLGREPASPHTHEKNWMWMSQVCIPISLLEKRGSHPFSSKHSTFETCGETPGCFSQTSSQMAHGSLHLHMYIYIFQDHRIYDIQYISVHIRETLSSGMDWLAEVAGRTCLAFFQVPMALVKVRYVPRSRSPDWQHEMDKNHVKRGVHGLCVFLFPEWYGCWLPRFCAIHNKH